MGMVEFASHWAKRCLSEPRVASLRAAYLAGKSRLAPALRLVHGRFGVADLCAHLEQRIGRDFEILMVHSSLNGMQPMYDGSALETVRMLVDYCGPRRTLAMPAFYFGDPAVGGMSVRTGLAVRQARQPAVDRAGGSLTQYPDAMIVERRRCGVQMQNQQLDRRQLASTAARVRAD